MLIISYFFHEFLRLQPVEAIKKMIKKGVEEKNIKDSLYTFFPSIFCMTRRKEDELTQVFYEYIRCIDLEIGKALHLHNLNPAIAEAREGRGNSTIVMLYACNSVWYQVFHFY